jgi:hypothetical protein
MGPVLRRSVGVIRSVALSSLLLGASCTAFVTPPAIPLDAVEVFVLSEAIHTGLVLPPDPAANGDRDQYVEFGFGDWGWWALAHDSWYHGFATAFWPTEGALGRRTFGARTADELPSRVGLATLQPILVSRDKAIALRRELQAQFDQSRKRVVVRRDVGFKFVPSEPYTLLNNCADVAAHWLTSLGCSVSWAPVRYDLSVSLVDGAGASSQPMDSSRSQT